MKPKILIVNKFYYPRGGDCICAINLRHLLTAHGYRTAVFSMNYPENLPTDDSAYFASEVNFAGPLRDKLKAVRRMLGYGDIRKSFSKILNDFKPEIVHLHNIHSYLSPQLAVMAHKAGCRVLWTLHDYKLVCPSYSCLSSGKVCEACVMDKNPRHVVQKRCMKGSRAASLLAYIEAKKWSAKRLQRYVDAFICPSEFMRQMMIKGGYDANLLHVNCNYLEEDRFMLNDTKEELTSGVKSRMSQEPYYCYVGRLSPEKGVDVLLEAATRLPYRLKIAGGGPSADALRNKYQGHALIEFLGHLGGPAVGEMISGARVSVIPSVCYENNPLSVIESLSVGTPVVGSDIGGIPELIEPGHTGLLARPGDRDSLCNAIREAFAHEWDRDAIATKASQRFSSKAYLSRLERIYNI